MRRPYHILRSLLTALVLLPVVSYAELPKKHHSPCDIRYPSDATIEWKCWTLRAGETLETLFGERWSSVARFNRIDRRHVHAGVSIKIPKQIEDVEYFAPLPLLYLAVEQDRRFILINLSEQFLGAYEYGVLRFAVPIVSGNGQDETPTGEFRALIYHTHHDTKSWITRRVFSVLAVLIWSVFRGREERNEYWTCRLWKRPSCNGSTRHLRRALGWLVPHLRFSGR